MTTTNVGGLGELWKDVPGYEGYYQASTLGRVRSVDRYINERNGEKVFKCGIILKGSQHSKGYLMSSLSKDGIRSTKTIHSIVALTFIGERPPKYDINHINGIKTDNRPENLEYVTSKENQRHAFLLGLRKPRSSNSYINSKNRNLSRPHKERKPCRYPKLTHEQVALIREMNLMGLSITAIAKSINRCYNTVSYVLKSKTFTSVR